MSKDTKEKKGMTNNEDDDSSDSFGELNFSMIKTSTLAPGKSMEVSIRTNLLSVCNTNIQKSLHEIVKERIETHKRTLQDWTGKSSYRIVYQNKIKSINKVEFLQKIVGMDNIMLMVVLENEGLTFGCYDSHKIPTPPPASYKYSSGLWGKMFAFSLENMKGRSFMCERRSFKTKGVAVYESKNLDNASVFHVKSFFGVLCNCLGEMFEGFESYYRIPEGFEVSDFTNGASRFEIAFVAAIKWT